MLNLQNSDGQLNKTGKNVKPLVAVSVGKYLKYNLAEITTLTLQSLIITSKHVDKIFESFWQSHCWVSFTEDLHFQ